jgi:hypothetical protein
VSEAVATNGANGTAIVLATRRTLREAAAATLLVALAALSSPAGADEAPPPAHDPFLAQLAGHWAFTGSVGEKAVRYTGEGTWVLRDGWLRLALVDAATPPGYVADIYLGFDARAGDYIVHWLDQFGAAGARVVATGHRNGQTLEFVFPYEAGVFRDTLTLTADGTAGTLLIEARKPDGGWSTFASYTLTRRR